MKYARNLVLPIAITLLLLESGFRLLNHYRSAMAHPMLAKLASYTDPPFSWERRFVDMYREGRFIDRGMHEPHPSRGWALKRNTSVDIGGKRYSTNAQGFRSLSDFVSDPTKYEVMIVGDSFTYGADVSDTDTWPFLLSMLDPRLSVFNLGTGGYGIDQMFITLSEEIGHYRPRLVIVAFIDDDLSRSLLAFRDYKKPKFVIDNGRLLLASRPIGSVAEVLRELEEGGVAKGSLFRTGNVIRSFFQTVRTPTQAVPCDLYCQQLNEKLIESMAEAARGAQAEFLLVHLAVGAEISEGAPARNSESFFDKWERSHDHHCLDTGAGLMQARIDKSAGHYQRPENRIVASLVYENLTKLPSWQHYAQERDKESTAVGSGPEPGEEDGALYLSVGNAARVKQGWGATLDNRSAAGTPLEMAGHTYLRGIGTHADSEIDFSLNTDHRYLKAVIGVDDVGQCFKGSVVFRVLADDKTLFTSSVLGRGMVEEITVGIGHAKVLRLVVSDAGDGIACDVADWGLVRLIP